MSRSASKQSMMPRVLYSTTRLGGGQTPQGVSYPGGLDLTTPSLALQPGALRACQNFEVSQSGGYARIEGYERYDGHAMPSAASYVVVQFHNNNVSVSNGVTVTQTSSGATGIVATVFATNPGVFIPNVLILTDTTGTFDTSGNLYVSASLIGNAVPQTFIPTAQQSAVATAASADVYRGFIGAVPGSGAILGVVAMAFGGVDFVYAFRANSGGTAVNVYVNSSSGWTQVPFFNILFFTGGTGSATPPLDGATLTQGGVTATVKRVMLASGLWAASGGTATGSFIVTNPSGGNFAAGAATISGSTVTLAGAQTAITLQPGGKFQFAKNNFYGQPSTRRIYGADGVNKCFEFDGTILAPITTGLSPDNPKYITTHKNFLFISQLGSILFSAPSRPYDWSAVDGAGEIAVGDEVTGMITVPGSQTTATLAVYQASNTSFLYGLDQTSFSLVTFNTGTGALPYSQQNMFDSFVFDNLGIISIRTTLNYGNFISNTLTRNIFPFIQQEREKLTCSATCFDKAQYRAFFSDGYGLWLTVINEQYLGSGVVLFPNPVYVIDTTDLQNGSSAAYFGSNDGQGYVYQMESGTSFDGANLSAFITLAWDPIKSPRILKKFRGASIEIQGDTYVAFQLGYQIGYGSANIGQPTAIPSSSQFAGQVNWDAFTWDNFTWDGQTLSPSDIDMTGTAENVQVTISSQTNYIGSYNVNSIIYHYTNRRGLRI